MLARSFLVTLSGDTARSRATPRDGRDVIDQRGLGAATDRRAEGLSLAALRRWLLALAVGILLPTSASLAAGGDGSEVESAGGEEPASGEEPTEAEKPAKRRKKKKRKKDVHAAQANSPKQKYRAELSLLSDLASYESTHKSGDETSKDGYGEQDITAKGLFVLTPSILAGPQLDYHEMTTKTKDDTSKTTDLVLRVVGKYVFGNIDKDEILGFAQLSLGYGNGQTKAGDDTLKSTKTLFGLGGGVHYFLDADVALTAELTYDTGNESYSGGGGSGSVTEIHYLNIGFSLFL
jgi:hypothetical protein